MTPPNPQALEILQKYWGYAAFRPLQAEIIESVLEGKDTLALLPTGGGKSICYQVPALCREGVCIVVSPLIALMKDQVFHLQQKGIAAEAIYSGMHYKDMDRILDNCVYGKVKLLYLSPERLNTDLALERIKRMPVNLLAVDEAHCISQWGYDFRPSYLEISAIREWLPNTPILAVTATATSEVVVDIQEKLDFAQPNVLQKSFARENLAYVVLHEEVKYTKLLDILLKVPGSAVVYARSRRRTVEMARYLERQRISAAAYHAGLTLEARSAVQEAWLNGQCRVVVATNAFGMGIDKADVRVVVHLDLPDSLEAYFQEAGRAGRDGKKAYAVLLYQDSDREMLIRNWELSFPAMEDLRRVYQALGSYSQIAVGGGEGAAFDFDLLQFAKTYDLAPLETFSALKILQQEGWIVLTEAVYVPSSLKVLIDKEELYAFLIQHRQFDRILKTILRTYQGAFRDFVKISESHLAKFLKMSVEKLRKAFQQLQQEGIIQYRPQKDQPQLIFTQERVDGHNLTIDRERYQLLQKRQGERIQQAIAYAEQAKCRHQQLLAYFGETEVAPCGICDVCLGRTKTDLSDTDFELIRERLLELLASEALALNTLVEHFSPKKREQVLQALQYLLEEEILQEQDGKIRIR